MSRKDSQSNHSKPPPRFSEKWLDGQPADLREAQLALAESEERFRATFEQAPVGIVHGDLTGKIHLANARIRELFRYDDEDQEFLRLRLWECTHPEDFWTVKQFKQLLVGEIEDYTVEKRYLDKEGDTWWASVRCSMARDDSGQPKYFIVTVEDITERKKAEEVLKQSHEELETKVADRTAELEAANTALKVMLNHRAEEKKELQDKVVASAQQLIVPFAERLLASGLSADQKALAQAVKVSVDEITSSFASRLSSKLVGLTPKEMEVALLVKDGKSSSEIADLLSISDNAVAFHRRNIRGKLGLKNKKRNLCTYLRQMAD